MREDLPCPPCTYDSTRFMGGGPRVSGGRFRLVSCADAGRAGSRSGARLGWRGPLSAALAGSRAAPWPPEGVEARQGRDACSRVRVRPPAGFRAGPLIAPARRVLPGVLVAGRARRRRPRSGRSAAQGLDRHQVLGHRRCAGARRGPAPRSRPAPPPTRPPARPPWSSGAQVPPTPGTPAGRSSGRDQVRWSANAHRVRRFQYRRGRPEGSSSVWSGSTNWPRPR